MFGQDIYRVGGVHLDLAPQLADVDPWIINIVYVLVAPDLLKQFALCHHLTGVLDQHNQQLELSRREMNLRALDVNLTALEIDIQIAVVVAYFAFGPAHLGTAQQGLDPGDKLVEADRLDEIFVRARVQPFYDVFFGDRVSRQHHDGRFSDLTDPLAHGQAIHLRHNDVKHHDIGPFRVEQPQPIDTAPRQEHVK